MKTSPWTNTSIPLLRDFVVFFGERTPNEPDPTMALSQQRGFFTSQKTGFLGSENPDPLDLRNFVEDREALRPSCKRSAQGDDVRLLDDPKIFLRNTGGWEVGYVFIWLSICVPAPPFSWWESHFDHLPNLDEHYSKTDAKKDNPSS